MGEPVRWLTADQQAVWRTYLTATALLNEALERQLQEEAGLTLGDYEVLVLLSEAPGLELRMSQLAESLVHSRSRVTYSVRTMESRGLVERRACPHDGRGVNCVLTDKGMRVLREAAPGHVAAVRRHLVDALTPAQYSALGQIMHTIATGIDEAKR